MRLTQIRLTLWCVLALSSVVVFGLQSAQAADKAPTKMPIKTAEKIPQYALDATWPKLPLPNNWALGLINGIHVDAKNHLWMYHSPELVPKNTLGAMQTPATSKCCVPAPAIIEFDEAGNVLRAWGGPEDAKVQGYDWPTAGHGLYVDYKGNIWIGGSLNPNHMRPGDTREPDGMYLKFSPEGKFLLQIGGRGAKGSLDTTMLSGAAAVDVDPVTNEAFIADGYGNHRVIVFDADTGKFKRLWGAYGKPPSDEKFPRYAGGTDIPQQFNLVHCIRSASDGLLYVCDRLNNRIQVFKKDGTFVTEHFYEPTTGGSGSVGNVSMWPDAKNTFMVMNDPGNFQTVILRRSDLAELSRFGHYGTWAGEYESPHQMEFDLKGNIYTSEDHRVQKLKIINGVKP